MIGSGDVPSGDSKKETFPTKSTGLGYRQPSPAIPESSPRPGDIWNGRLDGDKEEAGPTFRMVRCPVNPMGLGKL